VKGFARLLLLAALTPAGAGAAEPERFVVGVYLYDPLPVRFALKNPGADARATVFDVLSGRRIPSDAGGTMTVSVLPGSAALIYVGRNDDAGKVRALLEQRTARSNRTPRPAYDQSPPG